MEPTTPERNHTEGADATAVFAHPARVVLDRAAGSGASEPGGSLLELARARAVDPSIFDEEGRSPFFWTALISNNSLDAYFTRMARSSLKNYRDDAEAGVAFLNSHRSGGLFSGGAELPLGQSIAARFTGAQGNGQARVEADFYTIRGLSLNGGLSTDQFLDGVRAGVIRDVSIGFHGGEFRCSICTRDMLRDWDCIHIPGVEYPVLDKDNHPTGERTIAIADVENAHLAEVSAVYDGATPGAAILKAQSEAQGGRLRPTTARFLEERYRIRLPGTGRRYAGTDLPDGQEQEQENPMPTKRDAPAAEEIPAATDPAPAAAVPETPAETEEEETPAPAPAAGTPTSVTVTVDLLAPVRFALSAAAVPESETRDVEHTVRWLCAEVTRLRPLADDGTRYRGDVMADALKQGRRALGEKFAQERYTAMLERSTLDEIKGMRDDWREAADAAQPVGRQTIDRHEPGAAGAGQTGQHNGVPDAAYRAR